MLQYIMHREHVAQYRWPQSIQENNYIWKVITLYAIFPLQIFLSLSFPSLCLLHEVSWSVCDDGIFCPLASYTGKCTQSYICTPYRHIMAVHSILFYVSLNSYILIINSYYQYFVIVTAKVDIYKLPVAYSSINKLLLCHNL